ncbi:Protein of unknown function (DUF2922) [Desulfitobacterium dichloroeliminans LMG P-21439]|uniref:DUF2922 domain-containing protein n=1 Tax=Desulfitobacterium dichloroeliminans (strain LMG P-21439 / DCA1) TaxID=871963 RepID=L0F371_DESDL|nr:DUF2922 domain-containing protein [Desulfitobacterium dichloroeliminans]AGA68299.1 Protein of unknown function (DUF2922) [Desulfitobacterium dichloroeliminans LMG P-21439]
MATSTQKVLRLTFATTLGNSFTITLPNPREDLTTLEAEAVMNLIVAKNMFMTSVGELTGKRDIKVIDTTTADLYDPPQF